MEEPRFETLTKKNAQSFFDTFIARQDRALEEFFRRLDAQGGPRREVLDFSPDSLVPLWTWLRPRMRGAELHPEPGELPFWYDVQVRNNPHSGSPVTTETAWWVDGLAYYFAEVVLRNLRGLKWTLFSDPKAPLWHLKPILSGSAYVFPLRAMFISALQAIDKIKIDSDRRLLDLYEIFRNDVDKFYEQQAEKPQAETKP